MNSSKDGNSATALAQENGPYQWLVMQEVDEVFSELQIRAIMAYKAIFHAIFDENPSISVGDNLVCVGNSIIGVERVLPAQPEDLTGEELALVIIELIHELAATLRSAGGLKNA